MAHHKHCNLTYLEFIATAPLYVCVCAYQVLATRSGTNTGFFGLVNNTKKTVVFLLILLVKSNSLLKYHHVIVLPGLYVVQFSVAGVL